MHTVLRWIGALALTVSTAPVLAATADFSGQEFEIVGAASIVDGDLQLTPPSVYQAGAAWLTQSLDPTQSFSVSFSFSLANPGSGTMADGIAFAIQTSSSDLGSDGGNVGYGGLDAVGSIVQTWANNRVGLVLGGDPFAAADAPANLGDTSLVTGFQYIAYDATAHMMTMTGTLTVDDTVYDVSDTMEVDLNSRFFGSALYIGFTGGTGAAFADQRITAFELNPAPVPEPGSWAMFIAGLAMIGAGLHRKCKRVA